MLQPVPCPIPPQYCVAQTQHILRLFRDSDASAGTLYSLLLGVRAGVLIDHAVVLANLTGYKILFKSLRSLPRLMLPVQRPHLSAV